MNDRGTDSSTPDVLLVVMLGCSMVAALTSLVPTFIHHQEGRLRFGRTPIQTESDWTPCGGTRAHGFGHARPSAPAPCIASDEDFATYAALRSSQLRQTSPRTC